MIQEKQIKAISGLGVLPIAFLLQIVSILAVIAAIRSESAAGIVLSIFFAVLVVLMWGGFFMVHPNQGKVLQLFGKYVGTERTAGLKWANPFYSKKALSLRVRNFESGKLKVNDSLGNPVEIVAVVVWRVVDTAEAVFEVDDFRSFVQIQTEAALCNMATNYPYDQHTEGEKSLRSHTVEIADDLRVEIQERLGKAGVEVMESRISHLAYSPEIAQAMLQRQQATAIVAARRKIVDGAVGMVEQALEELSAKQVVDLDDERKAAMVGNLLVVLCGDHNAQPIVNAGSLY